MGQVIRKNEKQLDKKEGREGKRKKGVRVKGLRRRKMEDIN